jgi:8-oxo-dGTP pyrophosphatase MutT (NUDIX family)
LPFHEESTAATIIGTTPRINLCASDKVRVATMNFPVSIKGVLVESVRVALLENERDEWELPGGRLEPGEAPETCLVCEFAEELGAVVEVARIIDCWLYEVLPQREVVIITYGVNRRDERELRISDEHRRFGLFTPHEIKTLPIPEGYRCSIRAWLARPDRYR